MSRAPLDEARKLAGWGFNVLPAKPGGKAPIVGWQKYQERRSDGQLGSWFGGGDRNYWIATGAISGVVVLDCDSELAEQHWRAELEPYTDDDGVHILDRTAAVVTRKGHHYYFALPPRTPMASWSHHRGELSFDVRADGTGVIAPPSVHETGHVYEWLRDPDDGIADLVPELRGPSSGSGSSGATKLDAPRSVLTKLLASPPPAGEGARNDWFTRVCGHYAKQFHSQEDSYQFHVRQAWQGIMPEPHEEAEAEKTIKSVWNKEQRKDEAGVSLASPDNGHLVSGDHYLLSPCLIKQGEDTVEVLLEWADFDIKAVGVVESEVDPRVYDVVVQRKRQGDERPDLLPSKTIADGKSLSAWLANHGVSISPPGARQVNPARENVRLLRYLESQNPPHFETVPALGWWGEDFICHEGVIRPDGLHGFSGRKPSVHLRTRAKHRYGFVELDEARRILNEVLTFHDETVAAVFGAWWATTLVKPLVKAQFSQFPIMAIEAPSESGKTTGMFPMLMELAGSTEGQSLSTKAAMTRNLADHNSGIVWIDDANDLDHIDELLRAVTGDGYVKKMGEDRTNTVVEELVAPVLLSGEALGRSDQKATADRRITLGVPSPVDRKSLRDPSRPQWDDIRALRAQYPELSAVAGSIVQLAAQCIDEIEAVRAASASGRRYQHKLTILLIGARMLARMTGEHRWIDLVGAWVAAHGENQTSYNSLIEKLLPEALNQTGMPTWPIETFGNPTPAFLAEGRIWFNINNLAQWWDKYKHGRIDQRTETAKSLEMQRKALAADREMDSKRYRYDRKNPDSRIARYWALDESLTGYVVGLVEGTGAGTPSTVPAASQEAGKQLELDRPSSNRLPPELVKAILELPVQGQ